MLAERLLLLTAVMALGFAVLPLMTSLPVRRLFEVLAPVLVAVGLFKPVTAGAAIPPPHVRLLATPIPDEPDPPGSDPEREPAVVDPPSDAASTYRVRPGDSLWAIACRDLGGDATDQQVNRRWQEIYAANRGVIGDNPDLIYPGQVFEIPDREDV